NAGEVARGGARYRLAGSDQKVATPPGAEDLVVAVRLERGHDAAHPLRPERNVVGIAVHEAHVAPVLRHLAAAQGAAPRDHAAVIVYERWRFPAHHRGRVTAGGRSRRFRELRPTDGADVVRHQDGGDSTL